MAVTRNEYLKGNSCPKEYEENLELLLDKVNKFAEKIDEWYGEHIFLIVSSGIRTKERQIEIYKEKAKKKQYPFTNGVFDMARVPMGSAHISCQGIDFRDVDNRIKDFVLDSEVLEELDLYCEDPNYTPTWCHLQTRAPSSKQRFFKP